MGDHYGRHEIEAQERLEALQPKARGGFPYDGSSPFVSSASRRITDKASVVRNDYYVASKNTTNPAERMSYDSLLKFIDSNNPDDYVFYELVPRKIEKKITIL